MLNGKCISISNTPFCKDEENDLAIAYFSDIMRNTPESEQIFWSAQTVVPIDLSNECTSSPQLDQYLLIGFPHTKNRYNPKCSSVLHNLLSITITASTNSVHHRTPIASAEYFNYNKKDIVNDIHTKVTPPDLIGMSGSPILAVHFDNNFKLQLNLKSIFSEYYSNHQELVGISSLALIALIKRYRDKLNMP